MKDETTEKVSITPEHLKIYDSSQRIWTVYPYSKEIVYQIGDRVFVDLHSTTGDGEGVIVSDGRIIEGKWKGRYKIVFDSDGSSAHVNPTRISPQFPFQGCENKTTVVITPETVHFRELATSCVKQTDFAIDIGCSAGVCTNLLHQKTKNTIGIDISDEALQRCRTDYPNVSFLKLDVLEERERFSNIGKDATVIFVDIGGNRDFNPIAKVISVILSDLKSVRLIVIKNREMVNHAATFMGRTVTKHKGYEKIRWDGRMEAYHAQRGWINVDNGPWWVEGVISEPDQWLATWLKLLYKGETKETDIKSEQ